MGVVSSTKQVDLAESETLGTIYYPMKAWPDRVFSLVVRTSASSETMASWLRKAVQQLDPALPLDDLKPMQVRIDHSLVTRRSPAILALIFAAVALVLAAIGTYGVMGYALAQRRREIGIRMALGALPRQIAQHFLVVGGRLLAVGIAVGLAGVWGAGRAMQNVLFGISAFQWTTIFGAALLIIVVALAACWLPARRAARVDPMEALRGE